jgi:hypothetical protein
MKNILNQISSNLELINLEFETTKTEFVGITENRIAVVEFPAIRKGVLERVLQNNAIAEARVFYPLKDKEGYGYILTITKN